MAHRPRHRAKRVPPLTAAVCGLLLLPPAGNLRAQPRADGPARADAAGIHSPHTIRVSSSLVSVPVSVTDPDGRIIRDLSPGDFRIFESGRPVEISRVAESRQSPLHLALLFDLSGSVHSRFEFERRAAARFLEKVWTPGDTITLVTFSDRPRIHLEREPGLEAALGELARLEPTKTGTAFFDSVVRTARLLRRGSTPETRQAQIVISDGADNQSDHGLAAAAEALQRSDTLFYAINPSGASVRLNAINRKGQEDLSLLASATGGTAFVSDPSDDLDSVLGRIAAELRAQYLLSYYSPSARNDGVFRAIRVSIPARPELSVRARLGYYASR